jgi:hypothetical protein
MQPTIFSIITAAFPYLRTKYISVHMHQAEKVTTARFIPELSVLSVKLTSCQPYDFSNLEVAPTFFGEFVAFRSRHKTKFPRTFIQMFP